MKCIMCGRENLRDGTSMYKSERSRLDDYVIPEDTQICEECAERSIINLKEKIIYKPIFDELAKRSNNTLFNQNGTDVKAMLKAFTRQHRYLQGDIFQALMKFIEQISLLDNNFFDPRNDFVKVYAKKASDAWR